MARRETKLQIKGNKESYDAGGRHVFAERIQPLPEDLKKKIASVLDVIPTKSKSEIAEALQHCDYDVAKVLNSFITDRKMDSQNEWMVQGRRKNKNKNKSGKKTGKENNPVNSKPNPAEENKKYEKPPITAEEQTSELKTTSDEGTDDTLTQVSTKEKVEKPSVEPVSNGEINGHVPEHSAPPSQSSVLVSPTESVKSSPESLGKSKRGSTSHEKHQRVRTHSTSGNEVIKKSLKDLQRSSVSISRFQSMLDEDAEMSVKVLSKSFQALRQALDEREKLLEEQLNAVITESGKLLQERQEDAAGLKFKCNAIGIMSEEAASELRNEIKHFVGERRIDEDLGKTKRFLRDEEKMMEAIKIFGEVPPIKHHYTPYKKRHPEPVKTKPEAEKLSSLVTVPDNSKVQNKNDVSNDGKEKNSRHPAVLSPSRLKDQAEIHAKLQAVVKQQARSTDNNKQQGPDGKTKPKEDKTPKSNGGKPQSNEPRRQNNRQENSRNSTQNSQKFARSSENGSKNKSQEESARESVSTRNSEEKSEGSPEAGKVNGHVNHNPGPRRTRRHYVRKEPGNPITLTNHNSHVPNGKEKNSEESGANSEMANGHSLSEAQKDNKDSFVNGRNGLIGLPQRRRKQRRVYHKKNPETEIKFPPPKGDGTISTSPNETQPLVA